MKYQGYQEYKMCVDYDLQEKQELGEQQEPLPRAVMINTVEIEIIKDNWIEIQTMMPETEMKNLEEQILHENH